MSKEEDISMAFDAMLIFLEDYWTLCGKSSNDIAVLLGSLQRGEDGFPMDIALWEEWKHAYRKAGELR